jgi:hypothetical protein
VIVGAVRPRCSWSRPITSVSRPSRGGWSGSVRLRPLFYGACRCGSASARIRRQARRRERLQRTTAKIRTLICYVSDSGYPTSSRAGRAVVRAWCSPGRLMSYSLVCLLWCLFAFQCTQNTLGTGGAPPENYVFDLRIFRERETPLEQSRGVVAIRILPPVERVSLLEHLYERQDERREGSCDCDDRRCAQWLSFNSGLPAIASLRTGHMLYSPRANRCAPPAWQRNRIGYSTRRGLLANTAASRYRWVSDSRHSWGC